MGILYLKCICCLHPCFHGTMFFQNCSLHLHWKNILKCIWLQRQIEAVAYNQNDFLSLKPDPSATGSKRFWEREQKWVTFATLLKHACCKSVRVCKSQACHHAPGHGPDSQRVPTWERKVLRKGQRTPGYSIWSWETAAPKLLQKAV